MEVQGNNVLRARLQSQFATVSTGYLTGQTQAQTATGYTLGMLQSTAIKAFK
jgi:hypothetical protein